MAKKKEQNMTETQMTETTAPEASHREIAVNGLAITIPVPFKEGHVCSAGDAYSLNQTLAENVSNNFRTKIKKALEEAKVEKVEELTAEVIEKLKTEAAAYADGYQFSVGGRGGPRTVVDPVEREMVKLATPLLKSKLAAKGIKIADLPDGKFEELLQQAFKAQPDIRVEAERRVAAAKAFADLDI